MFILKNRTIGSRTLLTMHANNINNLSGRISANELALDAKQDINNIGGAIASQNSLTLNAGRDINVQSTTQSAQNSIGNSSFTRTNLDRVAGLYVTNPSGTGILVASAGNNLNLIAADICNDSSHADSLTTLKAGNNIMLGTLQIAEQNNSVQNTNNYLKHGNTQDIGTQLQTQGDITLQAGNDINARAATISSEGALQAIAGGDITIENGEASSNMAAGRTTKKSGTFSSKKTTTRDTFAESTSIGSSLSADSINLVAGAVIASDGKVTVQPSTGDINITGSNVVATQDVDLNAGRDITIESAQDTSSESHYNRVKRSGFSSSGASVTYGSSKLTTTNDTQTTTNVASTVGSIDGNVSINAGNTYTQTGSDILTPKGDINIVAQSVTIQNATDTAANQQTMKYKQSGITLAVTSPVLSAVQTAQQMRKAASQTKDSRMQLLAAGTAALAVNNAKDAIIAGNTAQLGEDGLPTINANGQTTDQQLANQVGGINVSLSIGSSNSSSETKQTSSTAASSHLNAGGDININATGLPSPAGGRGAGGEGDINVIGSVIKANDDVTLKADNNINLQAAQNVDTLNSKNKGSSASIGISVGIDGFLVTASASGSKGKTKGNGNIWTETVVQGGNQAGDKVTLNSGTDTNIIGSQVIGNQIIANVGINPTTGEVGTGNLNIQSLQDTNQYKDKQQSVGGSVSVGYGKISGSVNISDSKIKSNYTSVNEQAGIYAGDGGFSVNVNGNTNLTGAVIASSDKAIKNNLNSLTTQTLTTSNIKNSAAYSAKGMSVSTGANVGLTVNNRPVAGVSKSIGWSDLSDNANSTTVSGISVSEVLITDNAAQQQTGQAAIATVTTLNRDVKAQFTTDENGNTSVFSNQSSRQ